MTNFKYLSSDELLLITMGGSTKNISKFFNQDRSLDEVLAYEEEHGRVYKNERREAELVAFITVFVQNRNKNPEALAALKYVRPPRLLLTYPSRAELKPASKITSVTIYERATYYSKAEGFREVRKRRIRSILIP